MTTQTALPGKEPPGGDHCPAAGPGPGPAPRLSAPHPGPGRGGGPHHLETHFIDSSGVLAWGFLSCRPDCPFTPWDYPGDTRAEFIRLAQLVTEQGHELYIADLNHLGFDACR